MTHNILFGKVALCDAVHIFQDLQRVHKTAAGTVGQVDLCHIAGHDHFGTYTHTGQKHLHLFGGGILRFVQNDERVIQGASTHVCERRDLDDLLFHQTLIRFGPQHIEQTVVERAQIRVYLLLQVAGQKTKLLPCFHRRAGQNDARDVFCLKGFDGHCNGQIRFTRTRRADAKSHRILADGVEVFLLSQRFGADRPPFYGDGHEILRQLFDALFLAVMCKAQAITHGLLFQRGMILDQKKHPLNGTCRSGNIGAFTRQAKHCAAADSRDGKLFL